MTIGIDFGHVWSHDYALNQDGEVVDRGRFEPARRRSRSGSPAACRTLRHLLDAVFPRADAKIQRPAEDLPAGDPQQLQWNLVRASADALGLVPFLATSLAD